MRVSNFLLWQIAYSEIWVTPTLWPDFRKRHLFEAILDFQKRERRYGGVIDRGTRGAGGEARRTGRSREKRRRARRRGRARRESLVKSWRFKRELAAAVAIPIVLGVLFFAPPIVFQPPRRRGDARGALGVLASRREARAIPSRRRVGHGGGAAAAARMVGVLGRRGRFRIRRGLTVADRR